MSKKKKSFSDLKKEAALKKQQRNVSSSGEAEIQQLDIGGINRILVGVNLVPFKDNHRIALQESCIKTISDLIPLNVLPLNICYPDEILTPLGWSVSPVLSGSADQKLNIQGKRKPFVLDLFNAAADWAKKNGINWFIISNSDILLTPMLLKEVHTLLKNGYETIAIARSNVDKVASDGRMQCSITVDGYDVFVSQTDWWVNNNHLFQPYILGERAWDDAYAAIMACHSKFQFLFTLGLCFHIKHEVGWERTGPYGDYNMQIYNTADKLYQDKFNAFSQELLTFHPSALTFEKTEMLIKKYFLIK